MSLDSQFLALSSMFTHDILVRVFGERRMSDTQRIWAGRTLVVAVVAVAYVLSLFAMKHKESIYPLGVWCFSGFAALFPLVFASLYWRRVTAAGAIASIAATAVAWVLLFRDARWGVNPNYLFLGMMPVAAIFAASALTLVVVSLVTRPPAREIVDRFFEPSAVAKIPDPAVPPAALVSTGG
jgi:SSS family solute:Na+ symporter